LRFPQTPSKAVVTPPSLAEVLSTDFGSLSKDSGILSKDFEALSVDSGLLSTDFEVLSKDSGALSKDGGSLSKDGGALSKDNGALSLDLTVMSTDFSQACGLCSIDCAAFGRTGLRLTVNSLDMGAFSLPKAAFKCPMRKL
jgi:hypothetical protein